MPEVPEGRAGRIDTELQAALALFYRLEASPPVEAFRVGEELYAALGIEAGGHREALLVHYDGEHTDLGLFISDEIRSGAASFLATLGEGEVDDLDAFCAALEGVSHFVYFTFAGRARPVSRLELELQAEIDKFIFLRSVIGLSGADLVEKLFDRFTIHAQAAERYQVANREARRYARWVDRAMAAGKAESVLSDVRRLYRMPMPRKLEHIARAA